MSKKPVLAFYPPPIFRNHFTDRLVRNIYKVKKEYVVKFVNIRKLKFRNQKNLDTIILNWYENLIIKKKGGAISFFRLVVAILFFIKIKLLYKNIYYIKHNYYPHNLSKFDTYISRLIIKTFVFFSDKKITLSPHLQKNYFYLPHPLYKINDASYKSTGNYFVCFGLISKYKNIDKIIKNWNGDFKLVILGKCNNRNYFNYIFKLSVGKNIEFINTFKNDLFCQNLILNSKGVINCNDNSNIVSGTFFYSILLGIPVFSLNKQLFF